MDDNLWARTREYMHSRTGQASSDAEIQAFLDNGGAHDLPENIEAPPEQSEEPIRPQGGAVRHFDGDWVRTPNGALTFKQKNIHWSKE